MKMPRIPKMPERQPDSRADEIPLVAAVPVTEGLSDHVTGTSSASHGGRQAALPPLPVASSVPAGLVEAAGWSWRVLLVGALVYVVVRLLAMVPLVTIPIVLSLLLSAVLAPIRSWLHTRLRVPHTLACLLTLLLGVTVIGLVLVFVVNQIRGHAPQLSQGVATFVDDAANWLRTGPIHVDDAQVQALTNEATSFLSRNQETLVSGAISTLSTVTEVVAGFLLLLLATFFMLRDGEHIWSWACSLVPARGRRRADQVGRAGWHTVGGFMRGQSIIATLHAVTIFVVLMVLNVPMAVALAVLIFVGSFIPMIGMAVAGTLCVIVGLIENGVAAGVVLAVVIVVLMQLEAHLLQPLIMSHTVEIHPLAVAVAVLAGTALGGIAGALFAVPLVAFCNAVVKAFRLPLPEPAVSRAAVSGPAQPETATSETTMSETVQPDTAQPESRDEESSEGATAARQ